MHAGVFSLRVYLRDQERVWKIVGREALRRNWVASRGLGGNDGFWPDGSDLWRNYWSEDEVMIRIGQAQLIDIVLCVPSVGATGLKTAKEWRQGSRVDDGQCAGYL
jgi:hypothetical protein